MSTSVLNKRSSAGALMLRVIIGKFDALRYLPKLANGYLKFNSNGDLVADTQPHTFLIKSGAYTAKNGDRIAVSTTSAAVTITLPASPTPGDHVELLDSDFTFDTNNLTIGRNSSKINGSSSNLVVSAEGADIFLTYIDSTIGWRATYASAAGSSLALSGNATVGGTFGVTGATTLAALAATTGAFSGLLSANGGFGGSVQSLSGAGAVNVTTTTTKLTTTGANALTLADGAEGQIKTIVMIVDGGDGTLTPTTKTGFSTITFNDVGDSVVLQFFTTKGWMVLSNNGCTIA